MNNSKIVTLKDPSGSSAKIFAGYGFNCYSFQASFDGQIQEILWTEEGFDTGEKRPSGSGIPILFPFPGRIAGTDFQYDGKTYQLEAGDGRGNAIHGFVLNRPWRIVQQDEKSVTGEFHAAVDAPEAINLWPADFKIQVKYQLSGNELILDSTISNPSENVLPCGLGFHPYFRVPLGVSENSQCMVKVPASEYWELVDMQATGNRLASSSVGDMKNGIPFNETKFDDVFTGLEFQQEQCVTSVTDSANKRKLTVAFSDNFPHCVIYNPPHREAICIEPYSNVPGTKPFEDDGIDSGMFELKPSEAIEARMVMRVDTL